MNLQNMLKRNINELMKAVSDFFNRKKAEENFYFALFTFCTRKKKKAITSNKTREHWCS